jgi:hypothetical protein
MNIELILLEKGENYMQARKMRRMKTGEETAEVQASSVLEKISLEFPTPKAADPADPLLNLDNKPEVKRAFVSAAPPAEVLRARKENEDLDKIYAEGEKKEEKKVSGSVASVCPPLDLLRVTEVRTDESCVAVKQLYPKIKEEAACSNDVLDFIRDMQNYSGTEQMKKYSLEQLLHIQGELLRAAAYIVEIVPKRIVDIDKVIAHLNSLR